MKNKSYCSCSTITVYYPLQGGSSFESEMKCFSVAIFKKDSTERYYAGVLFVMVYKAVLNLQNVDKILNCDHPHKNCWAVLSFGTLFLNFDSGELWAKKLDYLPFEGRSYTIL